MGIITILLTLLVLLAANALYVAAEFSSVAIQSVRIQVLADEGDERARHLLPIVADRGLLDRYIGCCQVGITLSSLILGAYGQAEIEPLLAAMLDHAGAWGVVATESTATIVVLIGLTGVQMVFGELVPKAVALQFPGRVALATEPPMRWSLRILGPLVWVFNGSGLFLLRLFGIAHDERGTVYTAGEIDLMLSGGAELAPSERQRLRRALWLSRRRARELMVPRHRVAALDIDWSREQIHQFAEETPYTRFPVYRGDIDNIVGILHTLAIVRDRLCEEGSELAASLHPPAQIGLEATADEILVCMRRARIKQAVVVDSQGRMAGLVTLSDVLAAVFGGVADEFKGGPPTKGEREGERSTSKGAE